MLNGSEELANRFFIIQLGSVPVDDEGEIDPVSGKEDRAGNRPRMKPWKIGITALGVGAHA